MRVLMCNSFHYLRGGSERCFFDLSDLLEAHGHEVIPFSMVHEKNFPSEYSRYFSSHIDFPRLLQENSSLMAKLRAAGRVLYSREARRGIEQLIEDTKPDIAHVHGIDHEISPSILPAIKSFGMPLVQTLHDYKLLCPNSDFVSNGTICEKCKGHRYYNVARYKCKRGSLPASLLAGAQVYFHKLMGLYERNVDVFISPSRFLKDKLAQHGFKNKVVHLPNFIDVDSFQPCYEPSDYFVFAGRLVGIKGITTLVKAMMQVKSSHLQVIGEGELEDSLKQYTRLNGIANVTFRGHLTRGELFPIMRRALFTVVPSEWYENYPMTILESFAGGTPVIGSNLGGIAELVNDGENGFLFEPGNAQQLAEKIQYMLADPTRAIEMGRNGRQQVEIINSPRVHYRQTIELYQGLLERNSTRMPLIHKSHS